MLLSSEKAFDNPWVGHEGLNRLGLHSARLRAADVLWRFRRWQRPGSRAPWLEALHRQGIVVVENFLPEAVFREVRREVQKRVADAERETPIRYPGDRGIGPRRPIPGGFDRWNGGTLNRYLRIDRELPETRKQAAKLRALGAATAGAYQVVERVSIYQTAYTNDVEDVQMRAHRDTFQPATKLWYFLERVNEQDGPLQYAPGSHQLNERRLRWEAEQARAAARKKRGGSFRVSDADIERLGYEPLRGYPVPANTLVLANVRGFHCRGRALQGAGRLALYGNFRPSAFLPFPL